MEKDLYLCPSMMCADFSALASEMLKLNEAGADIYHIDLMDGMFVPNFALGFEDIRAIRKLAKNPLDVHMMVMEPGRYIDALCALGVDIIYIHPEADKHPARTLDLIRKNGKSPGIAVNPGTSFEFVKELLPLCDKVLVMTVNPGYAGQKYLDYVDDKIRNFAACRDQYGYEIFIDGALSPGRIASLFTIGAKGFVLGTSALFGKGGNYGEIMGKLRQLI